MGELKHESAYKYIWYTNFMKYEKMIMMIGKRIQINLTTGTLNLSI